MDLQLKEALGYAAYISCTTFLPNAVNVITLFVGESPQDFIAGHYLVCCLLPFALHCGHHCKRPKAEGQCGHRWESGA